MYGELIMLKIIFGNGLIGVETVSSNNKPSVILSELDCAHAIGTDFGDDNTKKLTQLYFENEEGLDVLIKALEQCKACFVKLPDELCLGA